MIPRQQLKTISVVVSEAFGDALAPTCSLEGFRPLPSKKTKAAALGSTGRIVQIAVNGWGWAFEARRECIQIVVDLRHDPDELASSVIDQVLWYVDVQTKRRAMAAAKGISHPLGEEEFSDPSRLSIDVAAARGLRRHLGSDEAVTRWLGTGLREIASTYMVNTLETPIRVYGLRLVVPFLLAPFQLADGQSPLAGRPQWRDEEIAVRSDDHELAQDLADGGAMTLGGTPLSDRTTLEVASWPDETAIPAIEKFRRRVAEAAGERLPPAPIQRERRFVIERRLISVNEALC